MLGLSFGKGGKLLSLLRKIVCGRWGRGEVDLGEEKPELGGRMKFPPMNCCCGSLSCSG